MQRKASAFCASSDVATRDALVGAGVMLGATLLFAVLGVAAKRTGLEFASEVLLSVAFPGSVLLAMPFTYLKGKPREAQLLYVGLPLLLVVLIGIAASYLS